MSLVCVRCRRPMSAAFSTVGEYAYGPKCAKIAGVLPNASHAPRARLYRHGRAQGGHGRSSEAEGGVYGMVGDEMMGKIIERVRTRKTLADLNAWDRDEAEHIVEMSRQIQDQNRKLKAALNAYHAAKQEHESKKPWWRFW